MTLYELLRHKERRKRLRHILHVFGEQEFGNLISKIRLTHHLPLTKRFKARIRNEKHVNVPVRLRLAFEELGPTFLKFGQILSLRPDILPPAYIEEFEKMQDHVPEFPFAQAKKIIEEELNAPLSTIFSSFPKKPLASGSIAQVYKATLKNGTKVAVKVQRPNIKKIMLRDIEIMYHLASLLELHFPVMRPYALKDIIHEFEKWTLKELNFQVEAHFAKRMRENFAGNSAVVIPKVYSHYTTEKVLTMEYLEGLALHDIHKLNKKEKQRLFREGFFSIIKQVFVDGLFHGDPHPGNILILPKGRVALIDFGIIGHFDRPLRKAALDLFKAVLENDAPQATKVFLQMSENKVKDKRGFEREIRDIFEVFQEDELQNIPIGIVIKDAISIARRHKVSVPMDFVLFGKTLVTLEGVALRYIPGFDLMRESKAALNKLITMKFFFKEAKSRVKETAFNYQELAETFPKTALEILERAKRFKFYIDLDDADLKQLTVEMEHSSGNLSLGLMVAALIVGASLIITQLPYLSYVGFALAGLLGVWLIKRTLFK